MSEMLRGFLDNDSTFGRLMTRAGILIGANLMFLLFSFPIVTGGAAFVALYHVMLRTLRSDGMINPFKEFWIGFKSNFKQAEIYWIIALALTAFGYVDVRFCRQMGGVLTGFMYAIYAIGIILLIITLYLFPTMAAFADTIPHLMRNALYFAVKRPFRTIVIVFFNVFPMYLTYTDPNMQPLYAFLWFFFGFAAIAMIGATLVLADFEIYLPKVNEFGDLVIEEEAETDGTRPDNGEVNGQKAAKTLKEMKKLGM